MKKNNRIIVVCSKYSYSKKENGLSINHQSIIKPLNKLGYTLKTVWIDDFKNELETDIYNCAKEFDPKFIFFKILKYEISIGFLKKIKNEYFTFNWFGDDCWRFESFSKKYSDYFTAIITTDHFAFYKYKLKGLKYVCLSQYAGFDNDSAIIKNPKYKYDVSFVGTKSKYREWVISYLKKNGIKVVCFGKGWNNTQITFQEYKLIIQQTKINLNIKNGFSFDLRYILFNPKSVYNFIKFLIDKKNIKLNDGIKARVFEVPMYGGFLINDYTPFLEKYFKIGSNMICFNTIDELVEQINFFIHNGKIREEIKNKMIKNCLDNHTYLDRTKIYMSEIEKFYNKRYGV